MKRDKYIRDYTKNGLDKKRQRLQLITFTLLAGLLLSLPLVGCGTIFMREGKYVTPDLPKSELASIQIDTTGSWIQRTNLIVLRIDGKLALREEIGENKKVSIDEVLVAPGKHDMSLLIITESFPEGNREIHQTLLNFSTKVKTGGTYHFKGEFTYNTEEEFSFELIDKANDKVVSKSKIFGKSKFNLQTPGTVSVEHEFD